MKTLSKTEKTAVKKVKAQASTKIEVRSYRGHSLSSKVKATGKSPRVAHNQDWISDFSGMTMKEISEVKACPHDRNKGAFSYMIKHGFVTIG